MSFDMARYLIEASYTAEGAKGLIHKGGSSRRATVNEIVKKLGGTIEAFGTADTMYLLTPSGDGDGGGGGRYRPGDDAGLGEGVRLDS